MVQDVLEGIFLLTLILLGSSIYRIIPESFLAEAFKNEKNRHIFNEIRKLANDKTTFDKSDIYNIFDEEYRKILVNDYYTVRDIKPLDESQFLEAANELMHRRTAETTNFTIDDLKEVLDLTIKRDASNKLVAFLSYLTAFTEDSQVNLMMVGPSSIGKTYIPTEIAKLFPAEDVIPLGHSSPTAFFHDAALDKASGLYILDLSRKIIIFHDQPHFDLLERLRPLLSHDRKEMLLKITDRNDKDGLRTKNITIIGYPVVIFCTANLNMDEQEATRFFIVSPEVSPEKCTESMELALRVGTDPDGFRTELESNGKRNLLITRITSLRDQKFTDVQIGAPEKLKEMFRERCPNPQPRSSRDVKRLMGLVKGFALLNYPHRDRHESVLVANVQDIDNAFLLWDVIYDIQVAPVPAQVYRFFKEVIMALWKEKNPFDTDEPIGITREEILTNQGSLGKYNISPYDLGHTVLPPLESAGLIRQEKDQEDGRRQRIFLQNE